MKKLSGIEQETVVIWNEQEDEATVYTASVATKKRLARLGIKPLREQGDGAGYKVPKSALQLRLGNKTVDLAGKKKQVIKSCT